MVMGLRTYSTSPAHLKQFEEAILEWVEVFGLRDWGITVRHGKLDNLYAQTRYRAGSRVATVTLAFDWDLVPTRAALRSVACHEMLHVCLADLYTLACERHVMVSSLEESEELLVRRLENVIHRLSVK